MTTKPGSAREFDKVDRALELQVIDWLQWSAFPEDIGKRPDDSDMAELALVLLGKRKRAFETLQAENKRLREAHSTITSVVNEQAEDEGLWFFAETASEYYLQMELRRLHLVIEQAVKGKE